jgi:hypothetical protein
LSGGFVDTGPAPSPTPTDEIIVQIDAQLAPFDSRVGATASEPLVLTFDTQLTRNVDFLLNRFFSLLIEEKQHPHLSVLRSILNDEMISMSRLEKIS